MLDSNTQAEIDRDQPLRFRSVGDSIEHDMAVESLKAKRKSFISNIRKNHDVKIDNNVWSLRDALDIIKHDHQFWKNEVFQSSASLPATIGHLFSYSENENIIQDWYVAGALPQWNYVIEKAIDDLADIVFGVDYE